MIFNGEFHIILNIDQYYYVYIMFIINFKAEEFRNFTVLSFFIIIEKNILKYS